MPGPSPPTGPTTPVPPPPREHEGSPSTGFPWAPTHPATYPGHSSPPMLTPLPFPKLPSLSSRGSIRTGMGVDFMGVDVWLMKTQGPLGQS